MREKDKEWVSLLISAITERLSARVADLEKRSEEMKQYITAEEKLKFNEVSSWPQTPDGVKPIGSKFSKEVPQLDQRREYELKELLSDAGKQEHRKTALITAINMAMSEDLHIPKEWIEELNDLLAK